MSERNEVESTDLLDAFIVEHSDDGGREWEVQAIEWTTVSAVEKSREIPWATRIRRVKVQDAGVISDAEYRQAKENLQLLDSVFLSNKAKVKTHEIQP